MDSDETPLRIPWKPSWPDPRETLLRRFRELDARLDRPVVQARFDAARAEAAALARMLRERYGATRVRLFGSLARRDNPEPGFDIDLAVEGIPPRLFFTAWTAAGRMAGRRVDLVDLPEAPALLRRRIEQDGVDLP